MKKKVIKENAVERALDRIVIACGTVSAVFLLAMMILFVVDVVGRYFFNAPLLGSTELVEFLMAVTISLAISYGQYLKRHVFVEILYQKINVKVKPYVDIFVSALSFTIYIVIAYAALLQAQYLFGAKMTSQTLSIPVWPFRLILAIGAFIFCLAIIRDVIAHVKTIRYGGVELEEEEQEQNIDLNW